SPARAAVLAVPARSVESLSSGTAPVVVPGVVPGLLSLTAGEPGETVLSPSRPIALPPTVTGIEIPASSWVPPRMLSLPLAVPPGCRETDESTSPVAGMPGASVAPAPGAASPVDAERPRIEMALPCTVTGTETAGISWVPPRTLSSPVVAGAEAEGAATGDVAGAEFCEELALCPSTEMALSLTVIGITASTIACVPPRSDATPDVDEGVAGAGAGWAAPSPNAPDVPRIEIALPPRVIGTVRPRSA